MNKIDPTRYFYPQVVLRMQEYVEIRKCTTARPSQHYAGETGRV
jgi:hypothetical protein